MITSIRAILVDYLKQVDSVNEIVEDRITDIDYNFEDLYGASANSSDFPAISIEAVDLQPEYATNCKDMNQYSESVNLMLYQQVTTQHLRAKSESVKNKAVEKVRKLDELKASILDNLNLLRGNFENRAEIHMVRVLSSTDSVFNSANKSTIYQAQISLKITYSKGAL